MTLYVKIQSYVIINVLNCLENNSMQKITLRTLLFLTFVIILNGCGTKGPLYLPEKKYPQETPAKN